MPITRPVILTIPDVAAVLGIHHTSVRALIHSGELRARKVAGAWRISADAISAFMGDSAPE
jgi:excisionase family DNA binding protein